MAIQVNGTTVLNNSRQLTNITGADTATKNALVAAGIGGGTISFASSDASLSTTFTKPYNGYMLSSSFFTSLDENLSGSPPSNQLAFAGSTASNSNVVQITYKVQNPNTHSLRGSYWGDQIFVGVQNTTSNYARGFKNIAAGWTSQTQFPVQYNTGLIVLKQNERPCVWISDAYSGQASANSNLVLGSGDIVITTEELSIT